MANVNPDRLRQLAELLRRLDDARNGDSTQERADANNRMYAQAAAITGDMPEQDHPYMNDYDYVEGLKGWLTEESTIYVFVYGTLKRGQGNHAVLGEDAVFVEEATVQGYGLTPGGAYPYAIPCQNMKAKGEVYAVPESQMPRLDGLEGFPDHYTRDAVDVRLRCGMHVTAWIYVGNRVYRSTETLVEEWDSTPWPNPEEESDA